MATNKWTRWDEAAEFAIKVGPLSILFSCLAVAVGGMMFDKTYPDLVDDMSKAGMGALAPFSIKGIKELLTDKEKDDTPTPEPPATQGLVINSPEIMPPDDMLSPEPTMGFAVPVMPPRFSDIGSRVAFEGFEVDVIG